MVWLQHTRKNSAKQQDKNDLIMESGIMGIDENTDWYTSECHNRHSSRTEGWLLPGYSPLFDLTTL